MELKKVPLQYPVVVNGREITELEFQRRPKGRDLRAMDAVSGDVGKTALLISHLCELSPEEVDELDAADFAAAAEVVGDFLSGSKTSKK